MQYVYVGLTFQFIFNAFMLGANLAKHDYKMAGIRLFFQDFLVEMCVCWNCTWKNEKHFTWNVCVETVIEKMKKKAYKHFSV